jgi:hypothetical protein
MMTTTTGGWVGETIGHRYKVTAKLGEGGMGFVYRAFDKETGTDVVVKVPRMEAMHSPDFAGRFERELTALQRLNHPHVVKIRNHGLHQHTPFAVMDFLANGSLREQQFDDIGQSIVMPLEAVPNWLGPIADALDFIHSQGFIHRDVKPDNILFDQQGCPFLGDFGVAKLVRDEATPQQVKTREGRLMGTPEYMAPELLLGHKYDGQIDQYALGVTLYEMLTGQIPFMDATETAMMLKQVTEPPPDLCALRPSVPPALAAAVSRALAKKPEERFSSCLAFSLAVVSALKGELSDTETTAAPRIVEPMRALNCHHCKKRIGVQVRKLGQRVRCVRCKEYFVPRVDEGEPVDDAVAEAARNKQRSKNVSAKGGMPEARPTPKMGMRDTAGNVQGIAPPVKLTPHDPFATETEANIRLTFPPHFATGEETPALSPRTTNPKPPMPPREERVSPSGPPPFTPLEASVAVLPDVRLPSLFPTKDDTTVQLKNAIPGPDSDDTAIQLKMSTPSPAPNSKMQASITDTLPPEPEDDTTIQLKAIDLPPPQHRSSGRLMVVGAFVLILVVFGFVWYLLTR